MVAAAMPQAAVDVSQAGSQLRRRRGVRHERPGMEQADRPARPSGSMREAGAVLGVVTVLSFISRFYRLAEPPHVW